MATNVCSINVVLDDVERVANTIARMAAHLDVAPNDDPAKRAMLNFGEIDPARDCPIKSKYVGGQIVVTCSLSHELQRIADMVPA